MDNIKNFTVGEEIANSIAHGIGALLSIAALVILIVAAVIRGSIWHVVSFTIYGSTLVILYTFSTIYHALTHKTAKYVFEILDHSAIYLLIAGTYTPFTLIVFHGTFGWTLFGIVWSLAAIGIVFKAFFVKRFMIISTMIYILMGWMIVMGIKQLFANLPKGGIIWLVIGGLAYTLGTFFYMYRKVRYFHFVWHLFVLAGSICHFFAVLFYILPIKVN